MAVSQINSTSVLSRFQTHETLTVNILQAQSVSLKLQLTYDIIQQLVVCWETAQRVKVQIMSTNYSINQSINQSISLLNKQLQYMISSVYYAHQISAVFTHNFTELINMLFSKIQADYFFVNSFIHSPVQQSTGQITTLTETLTLGSFIRFLILMHACMLCLKVQTVWRKFYRLKNVVHDDKLTVECTAFGFHPTSLLLC